MGKTNTQMLAIARKYKGDGGSRFRKFAGLGSGDPWCAAFVSYIFKEGDNKALFYDGKITTYCPNAIKWCQANLAQIPIYLTLPMDIIFFDWEPNGNPNHIGFTTERDTDQSVFTIEGNTSGGIVAEKKRALYGKKNGKKVQYIQGVFRPHYKATYTTSKKLVIDGFFGNNSIAMLQKALGVKVDGILGKGTVKALQKRVGVTQDGAWGPKTTKAVQKKLCKFKGDDVDGEAGAKTVKALQKWINNQVFPSTVKKDTSKTAEVQIPATKTKGDSIADTAISYIGKVKYKKGGTSLKKGCDCTGFVQAIHKLNGITLRVQDPWGKSIGKDVSKAKPGDVIEYYIGKELHHHGIYIGNNKIVHCSTSHKDWTKDCCKSNVNLSGMKIGDIRRCWK